MREKFKSYNPYIMSVFIFIAVFSGVFGIANFDVENYIVGLVCITLCIVFTAGTWVCSTTSYQFFAGEDMVIFHTPLRRNQIIQYSDIQRIWITRACHTGRYGNCIWVETIHFQLENKIAEFSAQMNIEFNRDDVDVKVLDEQLESSKFSKLKNYIEEKLIVPYDVLLT